MLRGTFRHAKLRLIWRSLRSQISPKSSQVLVTPRRHRAERMTTSLAVRYIDGKLWGQGARNRSVRDVAFDFVVVSWSFGSPPVEAAAVWHQSKKSGPNPWPASKPANKGHSTRRWKWANAPMQPPVLLSTTHQKGDKRDGCTTTKAAPREVRDLVS